MAAAVQLAVGEDAERVVVMGHSFGGAVAVRVGVALPTMGTGAANLFRVLVDGAARGVVP